MKVSVCVITYNHELFIEECLISILSQKTNFEFEVVLGEDGSKDDTRPIIQQIQKKYPGMIRLLPEEGNLGMMSNFIRSLNACTGDYIALCEGDDYWSDPNKLQKQVDFLEQHPDYSLCFTNTEYLYTQTGERKQVITSETRTRSFEELIEKNFVATQTVMYRNLHYTIPVGFEKLKVGDWPLHVLQAQYGKIGHLAEFTAVYRIHGNNSWSGESQLKKMEHIAEAAIFLSHALNNGFKRAAKTQALRLIHHLAVKYLLEKEKDSAKRCLSLVRQLPGWRYSWKVYYIVIKVFLS